MSDFSLLKSYKRIILDHPRIVLLFMTMIVAFFATQATKFRLDASADSLVLENDAALKFYREMSAQFDSEDILILTYSPRDKDLFDPQVLEDISRFGKALGSLDHVDSVMSIMTVPLIESPLVTPQ